MKSSGGTLSLKFSDDLGSATLETGEVVYFTRSERLILDYLSKNPGRILSRSQLLDSIAATGSDNSDRNIDFIVNRLRRKLRDSARAPQFIATRYGEGYQWIYRNETAPPEMSTAYLVVGPMLGLGCLEEREQTGRSLGRYLFSELQGQLGSGRNAVFNPDYEPSDRVKDNGPEVGVQLRFFREGDRTECIVTIRNDRTGMLCHAERFLIPSDNSALAELSAQARRRAPIILAKYWQTSTVEAMSSMPAPVAMHVAGRKTEDENEQPWPDNDRRLKLLMEEKPDDPALKILYASHLHSKYIIFGPKLFRSGEARCAEDEAEIERLVLEGLPFIQAQPEFLMIAAKLLYFVDLGYRDLALELADRSLRESMSVASSLAIAGQLRGFTGQTDAAVKLLLQAEALCAPRSQFHIYVLVILCQVLMAAGEMDRVSETTRRMYRISPAAKLIFDPLFSDPDRPSLCAKGVMLALSRKKVDGLLRHLCYISARLFEVPAHRENTLRTLVNLAVRRFGPEILHEDVRQVAPGLL